MYFMMALVGLFVGILVGLYIGYKWGARAVAEGKALQASAAKAEAEFKKLF